MKTVLTITAFAIFLTSGISQETTEDLIKQLQGSTRSVAPAPQEMPTDDTSPTRGFKTRSLTGSTPAPAPAPAPKAKSETRSVYFQTRGLPAAIQTAAEEDGVKITTTTAKKSTGAGDYSVKAGEQAYEVAYSVDADSKVSKDNILFRKGSSDFADDNSIRVVTQLAEALRSPSLAKLKFVIEGHASAEGSALGNQSLSQMRAERIVSVLGSLGVDQHRLLPIGFGETQARFPSHSQEGLLKQDRRVLIYRLDQ